MQFGDARWSLCGPGWPPGAARGLPGGYRAKKNVLESLKNRAFCSLAARGGVWGVPPSILVKNGPQWC